MPMDSLRPTLVKPTKHAVEKYYEALNDLHAAVKEFDESSAAFDDAFPQKEPESSVPKENDENSPPPISQKKPSDETKAPRNPS
uniref:Uncharacterized protein n=1 Tax=Panagrolaimus superbus TaxID=310955 RepID=A0A914Z9Y5_9BILA